jgi:transposase
MEIDVDALPEDTAALRAIILAQHREIAGIAAANRAYEALIQALKITIARLKKQRFGPSSEKIEREIEQLELALESLETARAVAGTAADPEADHEAAAEAATSEERLPPRRRGAPRIAPDAPRESIVLDPGEHCPDCGGTLRLVGEDVAEILDFIAAKLKVFEIHRPKKSCRDCERMVQSPAPPRPIRRGMAGPALLAHILVAKYDDHLPLYRQGEIFARMGADIPRSTLIDWCGQAAAALNPLANIIRAEMMASGRLHADDTPIRVLDPKKRRIEGLERGVKEGRIWVYVRDDRPWAGADPPAAAYWFSPDRKGEHPQDHLKNFMGILQADAYAGFGKLYEPGANGEPRILEAACWAHLRRDFHDVWKATGSPSPSRRWNGSASSTTSRRQSTAISSTAGAARARRKAARAWRPSVPGASTSWPGSPARATLPRPCATPSTAGTDSRCSSTTMPASPSTTTPPSAPSGPSRRGVHCAHLLEVPGNMESWFSGPYRHGLPLRLSAVLTASPSRSRVRIWYGAPGTT